MNNLIIRNITEKDLNDIATIQVTGWQSAYQDFIDNNYLKSLNISERLEKLKTNYMYNKFIVALIDNEVVGFARYILANNYQDINADCELSALYVKPNLKNMGIGSALFNYVKEDMLKNNKEEMIGWCFKDNYLSRKFYEKMGGEVIREKTTIINNKEYGEVCYKYYLKKEKTINREAR